MGRVRAYVGLGANQGDVAGTLAAAVRDLDALRGVRVRGVSRLYRTRPVGVTDQPDFHNAVVALDVQVGERVAEDPGAVARDLRGAGDPAAAAPDVRIGDGAVGAAPDVRVGGGPAGAALTLLADLKALEADAGRRTGVRWGPRPLDLDLLLFGRHVIHVERPAALRSTDPTRPSVQWLDVPHVSAAERAFVLAPLADLAPRLVPPGWTRSVAASLRERLAVEGSDAVIPVGAWDPTLDRWRMMRTEVT